MSPVPPAITDLIEKTKNAIRQMEDEEYNALERTEFTGEAGGGMVTMTFRNGEWIKCNIDPATLPALVPHLVLAAANLAQMKAKSEAEKCVARVKQRAQDIAGDASLEAINLVLGPAGDTNTTPTDPISEVVNKLKN